MNNGNEVTETTCGELSAEQRARISQNFRAAKARLARKRPMFQSGGATDSLSSDPIRIDEKKTKNLDRVEVMPRLPLSEESTNRSKASPASCKLSIKNGVSREILITPIRQGETKGKLCPVGPHSNSIDGCSVETGHRSPECISTLNSSGVPLGQRYPPCKSDSNNTIIELLVTPDARDPFLASNFFDDDFEDSIFEQIDALCDQNPSCNSERKNSALKSFGNEVIIKNSEYTAVQHQLNLHHDIPDEILKLEESSCSAADQEQKTKGLTESENELTETMPEEYAKYIQSLNDKQKEAACSDTSIPLMIVAGPGSGKTSTMVGRVLMLLHEGFSPSNILAMTFTTAAAAEMRERIGAVAGKAVAKELTISTFHSFSLQLCRSHAEKFGRTPDFLIYGHGQQRNAIIEAVRLLEDGNKRANPELCKLTELAEIDSPKNFKDKSKKWVKFVTQAKAAGKSPEHFRKIGDNTGAIILENYSNILKSCNALDYHDFISCSVKLLTDFPEVFEECRESWKAIVIDEFQDTSAMQYVLLRSLASHKRITIVGDEDQSIFSFNGADVSGFDSFRKDFPVYKEVRLNKNYRSTRCIIEAASYLIRNNSKRSDSKDIQTDNSSGSKITIKECCNEEAQCAFVVDKLLELASESSSPKCSYGNFAVLYRRQVTGKIFQTAFRNRKIPFNIHGVAFYRKKVVRAIIAMLSTTLPSCDDTPFRRVFKALLPFDKEEKKKVIDHIDKVSTVRKCTFIAAARDIFSAKISGTFKRRQLTQGRKVLLTLDMIIKLVCREQSISAVINSVANMIPQQYLLEQQAVLDVDGGKLLNEDNDIRSVLQYLLDDVSSFLKIMNNDSEHDNNCITEGKGCMSTLKAFIDYISERERENFRLRRHDNQDSVTLTTIHQSKGLEWDTVFIVKVNEAEIPLLHEYHGVVNANANSMEEERRLFYVAMTRARKKLFMLYVIMDSNWQVLQPSRFLREIPPHLLETREELNFGKSKKIISQNEQEAPKVSGGLRKECPENRTMMHEPASGLVEAHKEPNEPEQFISSNFLQRFSAEDRAIVSHLFHQWAKKPAFHNPKRLLSKVAFVIDERLRAKKCTHKEALRELKSCITSDVALHFAESVLRWEQIPAEKRAHLMREKQEHFQKLRIESAMSSSEPTSKQIGYLQKLGCTIVPTSRLHASRLIEEYKSL